MSQSTKNILVTGGAGFIGSHLVEALIKDNYRVTIIDNIDPFYSRSIKEKNIESFFKSPLVTFLELDILNETVLNNIEQSFHAIIHLAAKAGVRFSIEDPIGYQDVNVKGTQNLLEFARKRNIIQFIFASSSSVYGENKNLPWSEEDCIRVLIIHQKFLCLHRG